MGPREWGLVLQGFAWTTSGILKPDLLQCVPIRHLFKSLAPWNTKRGTKRGKGLEVRIYWAKYFPGESVHGVYAFNHMKNHAHLPCHAISTRWSFFSLWWVALRGLPFFFFAVLPKSAWTDITPTFQVRIEGMHVFMVRSSVCDGPQVGSHLLQAYTVTEIVIQHVDFFGPHVGIVKMQVFPRLQCTNTLLYRWSCSLSDVEMKYSL